MSKKLDGDEAKAIINKCEQRLLPLKEARARLAEERAQAKRDLLRRQRDLPGLLADAFLGEVTPDEVAEAKREIRNLRAFINDDLPKILAEIGRREYGCEQEKLQALKLIEQIKAEKRYETLKKQVESGPPYDRHLDADFRQAADAVKKWKQADKLISQWKLKLERMSLDELKELAKGDGFNKSRP